jgi:hypothetical protein
MPARASFGALRDGDAPRYDEGPGVSTKELVGPQSPLEIHGDIRLFTDSEMTTGAVLELGLQSGEGLLLTPLEGDVIVGGTRLPARHALVITPGDQSRAFQALAQSDARVLRVVHGPGEGLVFGEPMMTRSQQMRAITGRTS